MTTPLEPAPAAPRRHERLRSAALVAVAALVPFAIGCLVHAQGLDLLEDGLWLLGTRVLADGGWLHRDLAMAEGPGRFALLLPWWWVAGRNALALALLKATCDAGAGALGFWAARRAGAGRWAWLVPFGVVALAPVSPSLLASGTLVLAGATALERGWSARRWSLLGAAVGLMTAFGVGPALLTLVGWVSAALLHVAAQRMGPGRWSPMGMVGATAGAIAGLLAMVAAHAAAGALGPAWIEECVQPVSRWWAQWHHGGATAWFSALQAAPRLAVPFAEADTGERLAAVWPAHAQLRALGWRAMYVGLWLVPPIAGLAAARGRRGGLAAGVAAWAWCGWWVLLPSGDLAHLRSAWWGTLLATTSLLGGAWRWRPAPRRTAAVLTLAAAACSLAPAAAEHAWLAANARRPGLVRWRLERAGVQLGEARVRGLENARAALLPGTVAVPPPIRGAEATLPGLVWPHQPAMYFLLDLPLPTSQATLLPGAVRDPARVIADLERSRPARALLGLRPSVSGTYVRRVAPTLWAYLRQHYRVEDNLADSPDPFRVLARALGGHDEILTLPLAQRLADIEQAVGNDMGPALRPEITVGQSFPVGPLDLAGIAVRWRTRGTNVGLRLRVGIWQEHGGGFDTLLEFFDVDVTVAGDLDRSYLRLTPVAGTAGTTVAVTLELLEPAGDEVRLLWHRHDGSGATPDLFPEGTALVDMAPVTADLWFFAY